MLLFVDLGLVPSLEPGAADVRGRLFEVHGVHVQLSAVGLSERFAAHFAFIWFFACVTLWAK